MPTNLEEVGKDAIGTDITGEDITKLRSTKYLHRWDEREFLVWHHRMNYYSFKYLIRISKRGIIARCLRRSRPPPVVLPVYLESPKRDHGVPNSNTQANQ